MSGNEAQVRAIEDELARWKASGAGLARSLADETGRRIFAVERAEQADRRVLELERAYSNHAEIHHERLHGAMARTLRECNSPECRRAKALLEIEKPTPAAGE